MKDREGRKGIDFGEWDKGFIEDDLSQLARVLKRGGSLLTFHAFEQYETIRRVLDDLIPKDKIIWQKTNPMPRNRDRRWMSDIEIASWFVKKGEKWTFNRQDEKYEASVMRYPSESGGGFKRYHVTQKNLKMIEYLIEIHSNAGDIVLDPFMGGGTTAVGCINTNRNFIGIEIDKKSVDISNERIASIIEDMPIPESLSEHIRQHEECENYECGCVEETMELCSAGLYVQGNIDKLDFLQQYGE